MCPDPRHDPCTLDICSPDTGCTNEPVTDGTACDDHEVCTTGDACWAGACVPGAPMTCADGAECVPGAGCPPPPPSDDGGKKKKKKKK